MLRAKNEICARYGVGVDPHTRTRTNFVNFDTFGALPLFGVGVDKVFCFVKI